ncbi:hypothetical protein HW555_006433 [Spodoptera exigua]|uniref:Uncharacterized protein n=1 Tax=Spodoptera exigua TaxID=7107 RepID=A0A835GI71_SPOEX|nr:hypothetical protein HW555_006433 [Spodoptera exigua]
MKMVCFQTRCGRSRFSKRNALGHGLLDNAIKSECMVFWAGVRTCTNSVKQMKLNAINVVYVLARDQSLGFICPEAVQSSLYVFTVFQLRHETLFTIKYHPAYK